MNFLSRAFKPRREQILHYLLVGATFLFCYLFFGYWNVIGNYGGRYGYGCYDLAPLQTPHQPADTPSAQEIPRDESALD